MNKAILLGMLISTMSITSLAMEDQVCYVCYESKDTYNTRCPDAEKHSDKICDACVASWYARHSSFNETCLICQKPLKVEFIDIFGKITGYRTCDNILHAATMLVCGCLMLGHCYYTFVHAGLLPK